MGAAAGWSVWRERDADGNWSIICFFNQSTFSSLVSRYLGRRRDPPLTGSSANGHMCSGMRATDAARWHISNGPAAQCVICSLPAVLIGELLLHQTKHFTEEWRISSSCSLLMNAAILSLIQIHQNSRGQVSDQASVTKETVQPNLRYYFLLSAVGLFIRLKVFGWYRL